MNHHTHSNILFGFLGTSVDIIYSLKYIGLKCTFWNCWVHQKEFKLTGSLDQPGTFTLKPVDIYQQLAKYVDLWSTLKVLPTVGKRCQRGLGLLFSGRGEICDNRHDWQSWKTISAAYFFCSKYKICYVSLDTPSLIFLWNFWNFNTSNLLILDAVTLFYCERK